MARVSRATAAKSKASSQASELYPSINTLRSEQEEDDKTTFKQWFWRGCKSVFDFTLGSCFNLPFLKWGLRRRGRYSLQQDSEDSLLDMEVSAMKERLNFHFMNPFQKWRYSKNRRFPWKLLVQLVSIILVTTQLVLFAGTKFALTTFILENQSTFIKLFVEHPSDSDPDDPLPSPVATLITHDDLQSQFNYTRDRYFNLNSLAVATYGYSWSTRSPQIQVVLEEYAHSKIDPAGKTFAVKGGTVLVPYTISSSTDNVLNWTQIRSNISQIVRISQHFNITSVFVRSSDNKITAECVQFRVEFRITNEHMSGTMPVTMAVDTDITKCNNDSTPFKSESTILSSSAATIVDAFVMLFALISIVLCVRSFVKSFKLSRDVKKFFLNKFNYRLKYQQVVPLFNMWFIGIIISNILVLLGSILKLLIAYDAITSLLLVDLTSIAIGLAVFGQWSGLLRFLSYFDKYNMLLITLRLSLPSVIRFIVCTGILYIAFLLCGWLVLGPYHPKFRDPVTTSDCLFSLINGDDMFATYIGMSTTSTAAYVFSKIYLYVFIALFIYVVLSVFISLISDTYETLHEHWYERSKGLLIDFASGKLGEDHHHPPTGGGLAHSEIMHDDHTVEEDYQYLREASHRFGPSSGLIFNGGPELRTRSASDSEQLPGIQIQSPQLLRSGSFHT